MSQELDLVVVHWNEPQACLSTLEAFRKQGEPLRVTVVDNNSEASKLSELSAGLDSNVRLVRLDRNLGWGGALNFVLRQWLQEQSNSFCLISAHDTIPEPDCVTLLVAAAQADQRIGIACPQYHESYVAKLSRWHGIQPLAVTAGAHGEAQTVDAPHGTLMLVRRECLAETGLFDQRYFAYGDEHDLGLRAARKGWKVVIVWGAIVINPKTSTASAWRTYFFARNSLFLVRDSYGKLAALMRALLILANTALLALKGENRIALTARLTAVRDYFTGRTGRPAP